MNQESKMHTWSASRPNGFALHSWSISSLRHVKKASWCLNAEGRPQKEAVDPTCLHAYFRWPENWRVRTMRDTRCLRWVTGHCTPCHSNLSQTNGVSSQCFKLQCKDLKENIWIISEVLRSLDVSTHKVDWKQGGWILKETIHTRMSENLSWIVKKDSSYLWFMIWRSSACVWMF